MPYYVSQQNDASCSLASVTMVVNAARANRGLGSEDEHATQLGLLQRVKNPEWKKGENGLKLLSDDWEDFGKQIGNALEHEGLPRAMLEKYQRLGYMKFYLRPSRILHLFEVIKLRSIPTYLFYNLKGMVRALRG
jgi:hypothetical protein